MSKKIQVLVGILVVAVCWTGKLAEALSSPEPKIQTADIRPFDALSSATTTTNNPFDALSSTFPRRAFVATGLSSLALGQTWVGGDEQTTAHAVRAVGGAEIECRARGDCLERGEWDGAIGWSWGARERCDATDPTCANSGKQLTLDENGNLKGKPVPYIQGVSDQVTHVAAFRVDIGRDESGVLRFGLYGNEAPSSVGQLLAFLEEPGFQTRGAGANTLGELTAPVTLARGGVATWVNPGSSIEWGVPSQAIAYGKSRGMRLVDSFVAQPRPNNADLQNDKSPVKHDAAGFLSIPAKGLGYGGTGFESDDECYERAFLVTNAASPALDKSRRVVGQVLDGSSMAFLERLANLPTKRGIRGVVSNDGPPLTKVVIRDVQVATVVGRPNTSA